MILGSGVVPVLSKVLYCLRRVIRSRRALFQPTLHPEVGATQYLLATVLQTAMRYAGKSSAAGKVNWHYVRAECFSICSSQLYCCLSQIGLEEGMLGFAERINFIKVTIYSCEFRFVFEDNI